MSTWAPEERKRILEQYGKEGLTPNTYAWLTAHVNGTSQQSNTQQSSNTQQKSFTNEQVREMQRDLGVKEDGLYGKETIQAMYKKYGTSDFNKAYSQMSHKASQVSSSTGGSKSTKSTSNQEKQNTFPVAASTPEESIKLFWSPGQGLLFGEKDELKNGVDYRGQNSYTDTRVQANRKNSVNTDIAAEKERSIDEILAETLKDLSRPEIVRSDNTTVKTNQRDLLLDNLYSSGNGGERDNSAHTDIAAGKELPADATLEDILRALPPSEVETNHSQGISLDDLYGSGNWGYDGNGKVIVKSKAPDAKRDAFDVPEEWSEYIDSIEVGGGNTITNGFYTTFPGLATKSGFHYGSYTAGLHTHSPINLNNEPSLQDAYSKAYASGNRDFLYGDKIYHTTSYTPAAQAFLQAHYDLEYEKALHGQASDETVKAYEAAKAKWDNDELQRFGIDDYFLRGTSTAGYPIATGYNWANNVGQFGYDHGVARSWNAMNGVLDLSVNNKNNAGNHLLDTFTIGDQVLDTPQSEASRASLMKSGVSQALEDDSPELKEIYVNSNSQPRYTRGTPRVAYSYHANDNAHGAKLTGDWTKLEDGRSMAPINISGTTIWNGSVFRNPGTNHGYIYDVNDYGLGPNGLGIRGYTPIPVITPYNTRDLTFGKVLQGDSKGKLNYYNYIK